MYLSFLARHGRTFSALAVTLLLSSATLAQTPGPQTPPAQAEKGAAQSDPAAEKPVASAPVDPKSYIIGAEDVLSIRVWREPELSQNVVVRPDGKITLPLVGDIDAAGLTPEALTVRVTEALGKVLNKPEVMVAVVNVQSKRYFMSGKVSRSGPTPLVTPTTILQALSMAGLNEWANTKKIVIMRGTQRLRFNYNDVIKGKNLEQNIYLQDGDHIFVP